MINEEEMTVDEFMDIRLKVISAGYSEEIIWAEGLSPCQSEEEFLGEYIWVVIHSGMKHMIARAIESRVWDKISFSRLTDTPLDLKEVYRHPGKADAIENMVLNVNLVFKEYINTENKLEYLGKLPWVGPITKYHLAKNLGLDIAKPDRHLQRIAEKDGRSVQQLCEDLAEETGYRVATVDQILWRASEQGYI